MPDKNPINDFRRFELEQLIKAFNDPLNRHATRVKHQCDDSYLYENPHLLVLHFIENGGAEEFAKRRAEFSNFCEVVESCEYKDNCDLCKMKSDYLKCPVRNEKVPHKSDCPLGDILS